MPISSQFPAPAIPMRGGALEALALQAGQIITAKVIGPAPNGSTQVQIGDQVLNLALPIPAKPGATLQLEVVGSGSQQRLILQPAQVKPPASTPAPQPAPLQPAIPLPNAASPPAAGAPARISAPPPAVPPPQVTVATNSPQPATQQALPAPLQAQLPLNPPAAAAPPANPVPPPPLTVSAGATQQTVQRSATPQQVPAAAPNAAHSTPARPETPPTLTVAPSVPPRLPATPEAVLAQMMQVSAQGQGSVAALTSALAFIAGKIALPEPVARAAQQVMAARLPLDASLDGPVLQKAVQASGIFQESALKSGQAPNPADLKSALLTLRQALSSWLGSQATPVQPPVMAPPVRGGVLRARPQEAGGIDLGSSPEEAGKVLLDRTEAALSRVRLHQHASLPDPLGKQHGDWSLDLPVLVGNHQTLLQLQIHRDGRNGADHETETGWQMRFALNLPSLGEVGAQVSLRGGATSIMLWAGEADTAALLEEELPELRTALAATGLRPGSIVVRCGEPSAAPPPSGHFLDAQT